LQQQKKKKVRKSFEKIKKVELVYTSSRVRMKTSRERFTNLDKFNLAKVAYGG